MSCLFEESKHIYRSFISFGIDLSNHGQCGGCSRVVFELAQAQTIQWGYACRVQTYRIQWIVMVTSLRR
jgi:hypothetical protein